LKSFDIIIVGGGIAGMSLAAALAGRSVLILEAEAQPGYHASGRSAAIFTKTYGNAVVRELSKLSEPFFRTPPLTFADAPLTGPRQCLYVVGEARRDELTRFVRDLSPEIPDLEVLDDLRDNAWRLPLEPSAAQAGALDRDAMDIDAHGLLSSYRRAATKNGATIALSTRFTSAAQQGENWIVTTSEGLVRSSFLVNAAGAWADEVASRAHISPLGLQPRRRTLACVDVDHEVSSGWPFVVDLDVTFYFKPDIGRLIVSPGDETPVAASDAYADHWDVAVAIDRLEKATSMKVTRLISSWAGLRTFAPDESPVVGPDPTSPRFFWFAGQGGFGLQTAPALATLGAKLLLDHVKGEQWAKLAGAVSPGRPCLGT
jgi:D-arginine dehydrogenase